MIARLRSDVAIETARAAVNTIAAQLVVAHPDRYRSGAIRLSLTSLDSDVVSNTKPALLAAAGAVALVLIAACANVTNLLLVRASARTREIAVRIAIGARRRDIVRQLLAEGLVIGALGAAAGWTLAHWGVDALLALAPAALPRREAIAVDGSVAVFAIAVALACAIVVSLVPAWQATRSNLVRGVKTDPARAGIRTHGTLVAAQLALSVVLLVGAGLMARAFANLQAVQLGFNPRDAASFLVSLESRRWAAGTIEDARAARRGFYERLTDGVRDLPGIRQAGAGFPVPLTGISMLQHVSLGPATPERETDGFIAYAGYLDALGVPLVAGRYFTRADHTQPVVIVDEHLARELWPGQPAVGQRLLIVKAVGVRSGWTSSVWWRTCSRAARASRARRKSG